MKCIKRDISIMCDPLLRFRILVKQPPNRFPTDQCFLYNFGSIELNSLATDLAIENACRFDKNDRGLLTKSMASADFKINRSIEPLFFDLDT